MKRAHRWIFAGMILVGLQLAACGGPSATASENRPAEVERVDGEEVSRVTLSAKAAERLDIQTTATRVAEVERTSVAGGEVVAARSGEGTPGDVWVRVALSPGELSRIDHGNPARILPLAGGGEGSGATARVVDASVIDDPGVLYYAVDGVDHGLVAGQRVRVELFVSAVSRTIIPYASLIYDVDGRTWAYTSLEPLIFVRHPVSIDFIDGDEVMLLDGPAAGVAVVTVGAAELLGVELGIK